MSRSPYSVDTAMVFFSFIRRQLLGGSSFQFVSSRPMSSARTPLLTSPSELNDLRNSGKAVSILDASWFMPNSPRKAHNEFLSQRIPGAQYLDLDAIASPHELGLKHMMPSARIFADACESFGIEPSTHVTLYDTHGVFSSPRALFMFRSFGHHNSSILNGGLPRWISEGLEIDDRSPNANANQRATYPTPKFPQDSIRNYDQIVVNSSLNPIVDKSAELVLDARPSGRYCGTDPEPRPGLLSGHIPHSISLPFNLFLQKTTGTTGAEYTTLLPEVELKEALVKAVGVSTAEDILTGKTRVITSCGSGMTAAILWLGLKLLGGNNIALYDESWTGYAMRTTSKIETS
ncbi:Rhodanese-like domain-containing protein [Infundibulicybe gibba]|nr:Rhodanese-like domain-containing protein [Infundibulicybe gibba]